MKTAVPVDNTAGNRWESILSRKINVSSMKRHFAAFKQRDFVIDRPNFSLGVKTVDAKSSKTTVLKIALDSPSMKLQRHHYAEDMKPCISISYFDKDASSEIEIMMKFESESDLERWFSALQRCVDDASNNFVAKHDKVLQLFGDYIKERHSLQRIASNQPVLENDEHRNKSKNDAKKEANTLNPAHVPASSSNTTTSTTHSRVMLSSSIQSQMTKSRINTFWQLPLPKLRILIMAVGTRGDVQPFVQLGCRLMADGHRVRLATHARFRSFVTSHEGLEFYPLKGDPTKLSEFMVKTRGRIIPTTIDQMQEIPAYRAMMTEIFYSCWNACIKDDPDPAPGSKQCAPFVADSIISNPVTYVHVHCAEALSVPLHIMFPQPWSPTKAFPHPLSSLSYSSNWSTQNYTSYGAVDRLIWLGFKDDLNALRQNVLGLPPVRLGEGGWDLLNQLKVPFIKMWSPSLVPKPKDWPTYIDVVGTFFEPLQQEERAAHAPSVNVAVAGTETETGTAAPISNVINKPLQSKATITRASSSSSVKADAQPKPSVEDEYVPGPELAEFLDGRKDDDDEEEEEEEGEGEDRYYDGTALPPGSGSGSGSGGGSGARKNKNTQSKSKKKKRNRIVFVGFGSMIIQNLEQLLAMFLDAAALTNTRLLVQSGWSSLTPDKFRSLAYEAQRKAALVREMERWSESGSEQEKEEEEEVEDDDFKDFKTASSMAAGTVPVTSTTNDAVKTQLKEAVAAGDLNAPALDELRALSQAFKKTRLIRRNAAAAASAGADTAINDDEEEDDDDESTASSSSQWSHDRKERVGDEDKDEDEEHEEDEISPSFLTTSKVSAVTSAITGRGAVGGGGRGGGDDSESGFSSVGTAGTTAMAAAASATAAASSLSSWIFNKFDGVGQTVIPYLPRRIGDRLESSGGMMGQSLGPGGEAVLIDSIRDEELFANDDGEDYWSAERDAMLIGSCPHSWLFQRKNIAAVIHHGGAGTTAAGLRFGLPTWICPFFGDQFFWGEMCYRRGLGPKPCAVDNLDVSLAAEAMEQLLRDSTVNAAAHLGELMRAEDGVEEAVQMFYKHLPIENMLCDVSVFMGESRLAQVYCQDCGMKMCTEVFCFLHPQHALAVSKANSRNATPNSTENSSAAASTFNSSAAPTSSLESFPRIGTFFSSLKASTGVAPVAMKHHKVFPVMYSQWTALRPTNAVDGIIQGLGGLVSEMTSGVVDAVWDPMNGLYTDGLHGAASGLVRGAQSLLYERPMKGGSLLVGKVSEGLLSSRARTSSSSSSSSAVSAGADNAKDMQSRYHHGGVSDSSSSSNTNNLNAKEVAAATNVATPYTSSTAADEVLYLAASNVKDGADGSVVGDQVPRCGGEVKNEDKDGKDFKDKGGDIGKECSSAATTKGNQLTQQVQNNAVAAAGGGGDRRSGLFPHQLQSYKNTRIRSARFYLPEEKRSNSVPDSQQLQQTLQSTEGSNNAAAAPPPSASNVVLSSSTSSTSSTSSSSVLLHGSQAAVDLDAEDDVESGENESVKERSSTSTGTNLSSTAASCGTHTRISYAAAAAKVAVQVGPGTTAAAAAEDDMYMSVLSLVPPPPPRGPSPTMQIGGAPPANGSDNNSGSYGQGNGNFVDTPLPEPSSLCDSLRKSACVLRKNAAANGGEEHNRANSTEDTRSKGDAKAGGFDNNGGSGGSSMDGGGNVQVGFQYSAFGGQSVNSEDEDEDEDENDENQKEKIATDAINDSYNVENRIKEEEEEEEEEEEHTGNIDEAAFAINPYGAGTEEEARSGSSSLSSSRYEYLTAGNYSLPSLSNAAFILGPEDRKNSGKMNAGSLNSSAMSIVNTAATITTTTAAATAAATTITNKSNVGGDDGGGGGGVSFGGGGPSTKPLTSPVATAHLPSSIPVLNQDSAPATSTSPEDVVVVAAAAAAATTSATVSTAADSSVSSSLQQQQYQRQEEEQQQQQQLQQQVVRSPRGEELFHAWQSSLEVQALFTSLQSHVTKSGEANQRSMSMAIFAKVLQRAVERMNVVTSSSSSSSADKESDCNYNEGVMETSTNSRSGTSSQQNSRGGGALNASTSSVPVNLDTSSDGGGADDSATATARATATTAAVNPYDGDEEDDADFAAAAIDETFLRDTMSVEASVRLLARNKTHIDFIDFFLLYQEVVHKNGTLWKDKPDKISYWK